MISDPRSLGVCAGANPVDRLAGCLRSQLEVLAFDISCRC
jgi:hypothetical protein